MDAPYACTRCGRKIRKNVYGGMVLACPDEACCGRLKRVPSLREIHKMQRIQREVKALVHGTLLLLCCTRVFAADPILPNPSLTPGDTVAVTLAQVCTPGYSKTVRNVPQSLKAKVFAAYGIKQSRNFEVDHLVSLELGGSNDIKNLWPETYALPWGARQKDKLENRLHWNVCHGKMSLADAQKAIRNDWIVAYKNAGLK